MNKSIPFTSESSRMARENLERQRNTYKKDYLDEEYWTKLARDLGERLPPYYTAPSDQDIKYWLRLVNVPYTYFVEAYGWKDASEFELMNPTHGMKLLTGLILELGEERKRLKKSLAQRAVMLDVNPGDAELKHRGYRGESKVSRRKRKQQE